MVGIKRVPEGAAPSHTLKKILRKLCQDTKNIVYIVSGRDTKTLDEWLGDIPKLGLSAEHGCFIKPPLVETWANLVEEVDLSWHQEVIQVLSYFTERTPGSFIEQKHVSVVWHYRLADQDFGSWQAKECKNLLENSLLSKYPIEIILGKKNLEIRPALMNKGEVSKRIFTAYTPNIEFVLCAGDDRTDEDMFQTLNQLKDAIENSATGQSLEKEPEAKYESDMNVIKSLKFLGTCRIGLDSKGSHAKFLLKSPEELLKILATLVNEKL